jgi:hypothetical protein
MPPDFMRRRVEDARDRLRHAHKNNQQYGMVNQMSAALYAKEVRDAEIECGYRQHDLWLVSHST